MDALWTVQAEKLADLPAFWACTEAISEDLKAARTKAASETVTDAIDCARFITCMPALLATRSAGQMGDCYDWIWTAVAPTHVRGQRVNENAYRFLSFPQAPRELHGLYLRYIPNFAVATYYVAYKFGGLDQLTADIARSAWAMSARAYALDPSDGAAVEAMVQMTIWAAHRNWPDGPAWGAYLLALLEAVPVAEHRKQIAMAFITPAHRYSEVSARARADWILETFTDILREHERLQVLAVGLQGPDDWAARRAGIVEEISRLRAQYLAGLRPGESGLEVLEQRVSILWPLAFSLTNWGEIGDLIDLLGAWYRAEGSEPADADLLAIVPTHNGGAGYLWPGGRWLTGTGDFSTHDAMQRASGTALGSYYRGADGDHDAATYDGFRFDVVDAAAGYALEEAMRRHYRFAELAKRLPQGWSPRAVVVFPSGPEPVQALLAKDAGIGAPLEISFERPQGPRPLKRISVWAGGPWHEKFELGAIRHVAARAGWAVDVNSPETPSAADLRRFYEDPGPDVLWVISHGAHDPFAIEGTGLHLPDETLVGLEELLAWRTPTDGRRLLVLNNCSGATAQGRGGLARIGLAQSLVSGVQGVVAHLWPVHWAAGLAFGAALAACLEDLPTEHAALTAAGLMRQPSELLTFLDERFADCPEILERVHRSGEDLRSLTNWGCPVLLT
jgi:hypothetical protein